MLFTNSRSDVPVREPHLPVPVSCFYQGRLLVIVLVPNPLDFVTRSRLDTIFVLGNRIAKYNWVYK